MSSILPLTEPTGEAYVPGAGVSAAPLLSSVDTKTSSQGKRKLNDFQWITDYLGSKKLELGVVDKDNNPVSIDTVAALYPPRPATKRERLPAELHEIYDKLEANKRLSTNVYLSLFHNGKEIKVAKGDIPRVHTDCNNVEVKKCFLECYEAINNHDWDAFLTHVADDASFSPDFGSILIGKEDIRRYFTSKANRSLKIDIDAAANEKNYVMFTATFTGVVKHTGQAVTFRECYEFYFNQGADGKPIIQTITRTAEPDVTESRFKHLDLAADVTPLFNKANVIPPTPLTSSKFERFKYKLEQNGLTLQVKKGYRVLSSEKVTYLFQEERRVRENEKYGPLAPSHRELYGRMFSVRKNQVMSEKLNKNIVTIEGDAPLIQRKFDKDHLRVRKYEDLKKVEEQEWNGWFYGTSPNISYASDSETITIGREDVAEHNLHRIGLVPELRYNVLASIIDNHSRLWVMVTNYGTTPSGKVYQFPNVSLMEYNDGDLMTSCEDVIWPAAAAKVVLQYGLVDTLEGGTAGIRGLFGAVKYVQGMFKKPKKNWPAQDPLPSEVAAAAAPAAMQTAAEVPGSPRGNKTHTQGSGKSDRRDSIAPVSSQDAGLTDSTTASPGSTTVEKKKHRKSRHHKRHSTSSAAAAAPTDK